MASTVHLVILATSISPHGLSISVYHSLLSITMGVCYARGCENGGSMRCSGCRSAWYWFVARSVHSTTLTYIKFMGITLSSAECQTAPWSSHKLVCRRHRIEYDDEKRRRAEILATPREKPRRTHCTSCNSKFTRDEPADGECPDCGYMTCEDCAVHERRGMLATYHSLADPYCFSCRNLLLRELKFWDSVL